MATALAIALRRSTITSPAWVNPETISFKITSGFSLRGLSLVKIGKSAAVSALPISGRLLLSLSPPQPRTAMTLPLVIARAVSSTLVTASGVWA